MSHIPPDKLLPQDMVDMHDHGPPEKPHFEPVAHRMHATEAKQAMAADPHRWTLAGDKPQKQHVKSDHTDKSHVDQVAHLKSGKPGHHG